MVIEKLHGLHATSLSLHDRFTMLTKVAPDRVLRQKRRASVGSLSQMSQNYNNYTNRLIDQVARRLEMQAKKQALRQRLGIPYTYNWQINGNSGESLRGLRRSNSLGNLSQLSVRNRVGWKQSNGNLSQAGSVSNLANLAWRGMRRLRGGAQRQRLRNNRQGIIRQGRVQRTGLQQRTQRRGTPRTQRTQRQQRRGQLRPQQHNAARPQVARRGGPRGRGRGGITRSQSQQKLLSKEELDAQLDQYMSSTKAALDRELDNYMKNAMDILE